MTWIAALIAALAAEVDPQEVRSPPHCEPLRPPPITVQPGEPTQLRFRFYDERGETYGRTFVQGQMLVVDVEVPRDMAGRLRVVLVGGDCTVYQIHPLLDNRDLPLASLGRVDGNRRLIRILHAPGEGSPAVMVAPGVEGHNLVALVLDAPPEAPLTTLDDLLTLMDRVPRTHRANTGFSTL